jgi:hypothetical protein
LRVLTTLKVYNTERPLASGDIVVRHARKLGTHLRVNLVTEEIIECHVLLQAFGAMLDWIAAPNLLAACAQALKSARGNKADGAALLNDVGVRELSGH